MLEVLLIALPVACVAWTITKEEITREVREFFQRLSKSHPSFPVRKLAYLPTCYYCTSHYVTLAALLLRPSKLADSYVFAFFATVFVANVYLTAFNLLRAWLRGVQAWADRQEAAREWRLGSSPMIHTPGILRWAINGYRFKRDRKALLKVFTEGYQGTEQNPAPSAAIFDRLLKGEIPWREEKNGTVVFVA